MIRLKGLLKVVWLLALSAFLFPTLLPAQETLVYEEEEEISDPWESYNRGVFQFNEGFDNIIFEPVARGYDWLVPDIVQDMFGNLLENLRYPSYLVSDLVQLKFDQVLHHTGRFALNSTLGVFGLLDVAEGLGLEEHYEDFGIALAYHGVPAGPYVMIPILGPSNVRDGFGRMVDIFLDPLILINRLPDVSKGKANTIIYSKWGAAMIHYRAQLLEAVKAGRESSLDYYLFLQATYYQYRRNELYDGKSSDQNDPFEGDLDFDDW